MLKMFQTGDDSIFEPWCLLVEHDTHGQQNKESSEVCGIIEPGRRFKLISHNIILAVGLKCPQTSEIRYLLTGMRTPGINFVWSSRSMRGLCARPPECRSEA